MMMNSSATGTKPVAHAFRGGIPAALATGSFYAFTPAGV